MLFSTIHSNAPAARIAEDKEEELFWTGTLLVK
jgi:hypothetical protein